MFKVAAIKLALAAGIAIFAQEAVAQPLSLTPTGYINSYWEHDSIKLNDDTAPRVAFDGSGTWLAMWRDDAGEGDLEFARSEDNGLSWTNQSAIDPFRFEIDPGDRYTSTPEVAVAELIYAGNDTWVATWHVTHRFGVEYRRVFVATSTDNGQTWSAPQRLNTGDVFLTHGTVSEICLASDGTGNLLSIWTVQHNSLENIKLVITRSSDYGQTWTAPETIAAVDDRPMLRGQTGLTYTDDNKWLALFHETEEVDDVRNHTLYVLSSTDNGENWTLGDPLDSDSTSHAGFLFDIHSHDDTVVVFYLKRPRKLAENSRLNMADVYVRVSTDGGATFSAPQQLALEFPYVESSRLAVTDAGTWMITYNSVNPSGNIVAFRSDNPSSTWDQVEIPSSPSGVTVDPIVLAGGTADKFIGIFPMLDQNLPVQHWVLDIQAINSEDGGLSWSDAIYVNEDAQSNYAHIQDRDPRLHSANGVIFARWDGRFRSHTGQTIPIYARSDDNGETWSEAMYGMPYEPHYIGANTWMLNSFVESNTSVDNGQTWTAHTSFPLSTTDMRSNQDGTIFRWGTYSPTPSNPTMVAHVSHDYGATWNPVTGFSEVEEVLRIEHVHGPHWMGMVRTWSPGAYIYDIITSSDNGLTWTTSDMDPNLGSVLPTPLGVVAQIVSDESGNLYAFGSREETPAPNEKITTVYVLLSLDYGLTWSTPLLVDTVHYDLDTVYDIVQVRPQFFPISFESGKMQAYIKYFMTAHGGFFSFNTAGVKLHRIESSDFGQTWTSAVEFEPEIDIDSAALVGTNVILAWSAYVPGEEPPPPPTNFGPFPPKDPEIAYKIFAYGPSAAADWQLFE